MVLAWSVWEGVAAWSSGAGVGSRYASFPSAAFPRALVLFPAPALLALPSFSTTALAPGPAGLSEMVAL